jgi:SAM-dependent methyltransferase
MNGKEYSRYFWQLVSGYRANVEREIAERRNNDIDAYIDRNSQLTILDLGNGRLRPQYRLLSSMGDRVYGIDVANRPSVSWINLSYKLARILFSCTAGLQRARRRNRRLVCGDVSFLPFRNGAFDLVTSVAAFEHFLDVPSVVKEVYRVLKPRGLAWIGIHPFACLSGGHNVSLTENPLRHLPRGIDAWDHLRKRRRPFHVPLNEWRNQQYLAEVAKYLEILNHYCAMREGEEFLTSEIENELSSYSRDELTCGAYVIVGRKALSTSFRNHA